MFDRIPPQIRAILAGGVAFALARIGIVATGEQTIGVLALLFWIAGGLADYVHDLRARRLAARAAALGAVILVLGGCGAVDIRCEPPLEFGSATMDVADDSVVVAVDVLACGVPVTLSASVVQSEDGTAATLCVEPPGGHTYCETIHE